MTYCFFGATTNENFALNWHTVRDPIVHYYIVAAKITRVKSYGENLSLDHPERNSSSPESRKLSATQETAAPSSTQESGRNNEVNIHTSVKARLRRWGSAAIILAVAVAAAAVLVGQGMLAAENRIPDPVKPLPLYSLDIAILVNREGLESILVLAVLVIGLKGKNYSYRRPIEIGAGLGILAVVMTWFVAIAIVSALTLSYGVVSVEAATGLITVAVILIEMDWFVHGVYWSDWIKMNNRSKRKLIEEAGTPGTYSRRILLSLIMIGLGAVYREGFEVVLFLQTYYVEMGPQVVYYGVAAGVVTISAIGYITFLGQRHLPYKKMLVATGILLTCVVFVMVGEEVNEMQLAGWIVTTKIPWIHVPTWAELWFSIYPNVQSLVAQAIALLTVAASYFFIRFRVWKLLQKSRAAIRT